MSKRFLIIAATLFALGLIAGAYLVLRTTVTSGELETSTPLSAGKTSDELLDELLKLNEQETETKNVYVPPEEKNLTEDFLKTIVSESGGINQNTAEKIASSDFIAGTVLPYLGSNQLNLFPEIPDSVLKIVTDTKVNRAAYFKTTNKDALTIFNAIKDFTKLNPDKLEDSDALDDLQNHANKLGTAFENLSRAAVPKSLLSTHKNILLAGYSLQKALETIIDSDNDPLKLLIVFNDAEALGEFWQKALLGYNQASKK